MKDMKREQLLQLLGDLPEKRKMSISTLTTEERENDILETLLLGIEKVPAYFVKPKNRTDKMPAVLFQHSHGGCYERGKRELTEGAEYLKAHSFSGEFTSRGYAALRLTIGGLETGGGKQRAAFLKKCS